jgi:pyrroloquinoline quinone biosynthesis protein B
VAVSADGDRWFLLNASPEVRSQIEAFPKLHPRRSRQSPIEGILLTNGDLDHCLGLLSLRESHPLTVFATDSVRDGFIRGNSLYRTLERFDGQVTWRPVPLDAPFELTTRSNEPAGLSVRAWAVPGKLPVHLIGLRTPSAEDNVGLEIQDTRSGRALAYLPAVGTLQEQELEVAARAACLFFDGTFWSSDELRSVDPKAPAAEQMAHLPVGGPNGSLIRLGALAAGRRWYIHVNNTNPVLREDSEERRRLRNAGWEVAWDGQEVTL